MMLEYLVVGKQSTKRLSNGRVLGVCVYCETLSDAALLARNFKTNGTYSEINVIELKPNEISMSLTTLKAAVISTNDKT